ncbi:MAG: DUF1015 domain-containing protein [Clostridia bacterium]|nr:DUF1015 domain-containing protein [Clostridia bacterium]
MTFNRADILLPKFADDSEKMKQWSVVACDQYTSEPEYWNAVSEFVGEAPSTLRLTVPEIYLNDSDIEDRIKATNSVMADYMEADVFTEHKNTYIYVERTLKNGVKRLGIVGMVDLEDYDYAVGSQTKVRATEGTVISRIPPRLKVRSDALVELPHIMLLIDDEACEIIEKNSDMKDDFTKVYDFDLMQSSGHIAGYKMSDAACDRLDEKLAELENLEAFNAKYGVKKESPLIFAMGDGNHSLATAKTHYENLKKEIGEEAAKASKARYALCELVNLHDKSLEFEAIHRVVFEADGKAFLEALEKEYAVSYDENAEGQSFIFVYGGEQKKVTVTNPKEYLAVATVQKALDSFIATGGGEVDYIHGEDVVCKLCENPKNFGIILEAMDKSDLYKSVILDGALPRKTFSMGEACDKRFYTEVRKIK